jgi:transposase-like protein
MAKKATKATKAKLKGRPRGRTYTVQQKAEVIKLVELYGNISRVARETGVSRPTIESWLKGIPQSTLMDKVQLERDIEGKLALNEESFLREVYRIKGQALTRMQQLLIQTSSLRDVTQAFATLSAVGIGAKDGDLPQRVENTFIKKIYNLGSESKGKRKQPFDADAEIIED